MKILAIASSYPYPGHLFSGIFSERCVAALSELCRGVEVLAPRAYVPPLASFVPRWKAYASKKKHEVRNGVSVYRPTIPVIPQVGTALWVDSAAFLFCRRMARKMHRRAQFDAVVSFDLVETGGLAWRIGRDLRIPASGWAFGEDVRFPRSSSLARVVVRALKHLDLVFYQGQELLEKAAQLLGTSPDRMSCNRHVILPHGIPEPPSLPWSETRNRVRMELGVTENQIVILNNGRIFREKGLLELIEAVSFAAARDSRIICMLVGSKPAFDETAKIQKRLDQIPNLSGRFRILPACSPDKIWEYLCAADMFAFTSHNEGMPNSLLEAMAVGVPAIAFAIPPVKEIEAGTGGLLTVPPFDSTLFAQVIMRLAASPNDRAQIGERGRTQILDHFMVRKNMAAALDQLVQIRAL